MWTLAKTLTASDPPPCDPEDMEFICDQYGYAVALDGNLAVVGSKFDDYPGNVPGSANGPGSVYVYEDDGSDSWNERVKIESPVGAQDEFGHAVAVQGQAVVVGAIGVDNAPPTNTNDGSTFVYGSCAADIDGNFCVDVDDLTTVILDWGCADPPGPCVGDANGDGTVDVDDLVEVILHWGPCLEQEAPESFYECIERCGPTDPSCITGCAEMFGLF